MKTAKSFLIALLIACISITNNAIFSLTKEQTIQVDRIKGSFFGALIGDALGRPTEFIYDVNKIFKIYPGGITSFEDLKKFDLCWKNPVTHELFAPYTDDTAMARITFDVLLQSRTNDWDLDRTMNELALIYVADMNAPTGWSMPQRAPGLNCKKNVKKLKDTIDSKDTNPLWWQAGGPLDGGCGSVMRAHPFGLVFVDDADKAATWAAEHSKITHGHPMAQAACAAMAAGVAYAVQGKDTEFIIEQMISWAKKYDPQESRFNPHTKKEEKSCWGKIANAVHLAGEVKKISSKATALNHKASLQKLFNISHKIKIFNMYEGWAADDAIAAAAYIFALTPDNVDHAILLGVHTPGDSDSIASMAGALVGARVGAKALQKHHNPAVYEGSLSLKRYAEQTTQLISKEN